MIDKDPPIANPWMREGMSRAHEIKIGIRRDLKGADLEQSEQYFVGIFGAMIGFMMGYMGEEHAKTMLGRIAREIEQGPEMGPKAN